jgi:molybdate-binding protein
MESISSLSSMPTMVSRELDLASPIENIGFVERGLEQASRLFKRWNRDLGFAMPDDHGKAIKAFHRGHRKQGPPVVDISL